MDKIFRGESRFVMSVERPDGLPPAGLPEVAFAGRSNVGKSSLINALLGRKNLVRTSRTPGQTRALNFFDVGGRFLLVDMPGYGFAKVSKQDRKNWDILLQSYLRGRGPLRLACLLIDARHGLKPADEGLLSLLDAAGVSTRLVLTKADELEKDAAPKAAAALAEALKTHPAAHPQPVLTSGRTGLGIEALRQAVAQTLGLS